MGGRSLTLCSLIAHTDPVPYFYSTYLDFDLNVRRHGRTQDKELRYEWRLVKSVTNEVIENRRGEGSIKLHRFWLLSWKSNAFQAGRIAEVGQYKVQLRISDRTGTSPFIDAAEFTIKDKDEFSVSLLWIATSALIGAIVGAVVGGAIK